MHDALMIYADSSHVHTSKMWLGHACQVCASKVCTGHAPHLQGVVTIAAWMRVFFKCLIAACRAKKEAEAALAAVEMRHRDAHGKLRDAQ